MAYLSYSTTGRPVNGEINVSSTEDAMASSFVRKVSWTGINLSFAR
jgi:hypothetical protein